MSFHCTSYRGLGNHYLIQNVKTSNLFPIWWDWKWVCSPFLWVTPSQMRLYFVLRSFTWDLRWFYSVTWIYRDTWCVSLFLFISPSSNLIFAKMYMFPQSIFLLTENCMQVNDFSNLLTQSGFMFLSIYF